MPLMMDDELDELFGDAPPLQISSPLPKGLFQCVDELRLSGSCQKIAWSKLGCIAYITNDGRGVNLRQLVCSPKDGQWKLSEEYNAEAVSVVHSEHKIVHLSWNHTGNDLAVFDIYGQISVFTILIALNRLTVIRRCLTDPEDNLGAVVGYMWLNTERMLSLHRPAVKKDGEWNFAVSHHKPTGPHNPSVNKSALLAVTRGGVLRLLFQGPDMKWQDTKAEINSISISAELLSHAAMCADKDSTILLATHSADKRLRFYRVSIDFQQMQFNTQHLKTLDHCSPLEQPGSSSSLSYEASCQLSHLQILPTGPETGPKELKDPIILAVFSQILDNAQDPTAREGLCSVFARWEFCNRRPTLHSGFEQLMPRKSNAPFLGDLPAEAFLRRRPDFVINRLIVSIHELTLSTVLGLQYSDGVVEFRDRTSLEVLGRDDYLNQVSSLSQVGFEFPDVGFCISSAFSPNACAIASLGENYEVKLSLMQISIGGFDEPADRALVRAAATAFVRQHAIACSSHGHHNDLLAIMQSFLAQHSSLCSPHGLNEGAFERTFLVEVYRVLNVNVDYSINPQLERLFRNPLIQRCLAMQMSLSYQGERKHRSLPAKVAWTFLNLRYASMIFAWLLKKPSGDTAGESDMMKPDILQSVLGLVSWSISLMNYIVDELFSLGNALKDFSKVSGSDVTFLEATVRERNTHALSLILISSSRCHLKYNCRFLRTLHAESKKYYPPGLQRRAFREVEAIFDASPVTIIQFDRMLTIIELSIKEVYISTNTTDLDRQHTEKDMLVSAAIPSMLIPAVESFLTKTLDEFRDEVNELELYFTDISWLGLSDDRRSDVWKTDHVLDALRKVVLPQEARLRRCTRCCAVMEDVYPPRGSSPWMTTMQRTCYCGDWWLVVDHTEEKLQPP